MEPKDVLSAQGFTNLHPAVQCTAIIVGAAFVLGFYLALFTDFWDNLSEKKKK